MKPWRGEKRMIEIHTGKPIHLRIKKTGAEVKIRSTEITRRSFLARCHLNHLTILNKEVHRNLTTWYFPLNDHHEFSTE
jgi:hypothetical protein